MDGSSVVWNLTLSPIDQTVCPVLPSVPLFAPIDEEHLSNFSYSYQFRYLIQISCSQQHSGQQEHKEAEKRTRPNKASGRPPYPTNQPLINGGLRLCTDVGRWWCDVQSRVAQLWNSIPIIPGCGWKQTVRLIRHSIEIGILQAIYQLRPGGLRLLLRKKGRNLSMNYGKPTGGKPLNVLQWLHACFTKKGPRAAWNCDFRFEARRVP